jgi:hypothetical protein
VFEQRIPLTEGFADRITKGYIARVANAAGDPYVEHVATPEPAPAGAGAPADSTAPPATPADADVPPPVPTGPVPITGPTAPNPPDLKKDRKADFVGYCVRYVVKADGSRWTPDEGDAATKHDMADAIAIWAARTGVTFLDAPTGGA